MSAQDTSVGGYFFVVHIPLWQIFIVISLIVVLIYLIIKHRGRTRI